MKIVQISAIIAGVSAAVNEGYACATDADCADSGAVCCNAYRSGHINKKICFTSGATTLAVGNTPSAFYTKNCAVAVAGSVKVAAQAIVSALSIAYMT